MIDAQALMRVRKAVESNIGERVKLKANRGRKKSLVKEGVIQEVYPCIFTVRVNIDDRSVQTLSFTYFDILTSNVEVVICKNNERI
ncbi:MAG: Veg family protein [Clostridia bacterium]|nr:Veg protein [Clostridia bacterium]